MSRRGRGIANLICGITYLYPAAEYPPPDFLPTPSPDPTCQMLDRSNTRMPFLVSTTQSVLPYHMMPPAWTGTSRKLSGAWG